MKEIKLTQGKTAIVDDEDYEILSKSKWYAGYDGNNFYAKRSGFSVDGKRTIIRMHRVIMSSSYGIEVDHRNGNTLDNRKENLRHCVCAENVKNRKFSQKNNKIGIKGVYWRSDIKKFRTEIQVDGKQIYLGYFDVLGDADSAYRIAEEKYFGEFARGYNKPLLSVCG